MFLAADRYDDLIEMPLVAGAWPVALDAGGEVAAKSVDPFSDRFPADDHTALRQQVLDIRCAEREPLVRSDRVGNDFTGKAVAFQARHLGRYLHPTRLSNRTIPNKLAMPAQLIAYITPDPVQEMGRCSLAPLKKPSGSRACGEITGRQSWAGLVS